MLIFFVANNCTGVHNITNAVSISPESNGFSGMLFNVSCAIGYTLNSGNSSMICVGNVWQNKPMCDGMFFGQILFAGSIY